MLKGKWWTRRSSCHLKLLASLCSRDTVRHLVPEQWGGVCVLCVWVECADRKQSLDCLAMYLSMAGGCSSCSLKFFSVLFLSLNRKSCFHRGCCFHCYGNDGDVYHKLKYYDMSMGLKRRKRWAVKGYGFPPSQIPLLMSKHINNKKKKDMKNIWEGDRLGEVVMWVRFFNRCAWGELSR